MSARPIVYDLSPPISETLPVWPGDVPFAREWTLRLGGESCINLSALRSTVHLGSHADAPLHFSNAGRSIDLCRLEAYVGPCRVVEVDPDALDAERRITRSQLMEAVDGVAGPPPPRVLVRTGTFSFEQPIADGFASFHPDAIDFLADAGVILVGIDTPSVDPFHSKTLDAHHRLLARDVLNLEGLVLSGVPSGDYELIALPLRMVGADASPVRAVLRSLS